MLSENISTPIYVECDKMYRSKVCVQEFWYFVSGFDIQVEKSEYNSPGREKIGCKWRNTMSHILTNGFVVKVSRSELGEMSSILGKC